MNRLNWKGWIVYSLLLVTLGFTVARFTIKPKIKLQLDFSDKVLIKENILDFKKGKIK